MFARIRWWLKSWDRANSRRISRHRKQIPQSGLIELLERRSMLSAVTWTGNGGDEKWSTPGNWSSGAIPGTNSDVTIDAPSGTTIHGPTTAANINSLTLTSGNLILDGSSLSVATAVTVSSGQSLSINSNVTLSATHIELDSSTLALNGGTILNSTITETGTGIVSLSGGYSSNVLNNVTINGNVEDTAGDTTTVINSLTLNGTLALGSTSGSTYSTLRLGDGGTNSPVTISGNATIVVGANNGNQIENNTYGGLVTLGSTVTVSGGTVPASSGATGDLVDRFSGDRWLNLGTVSCTISGTGLTVDSANFQNAGTLGASNGGSLILQGTINNGVNGQISVQANSFVNLGGYNSAPSIIGGTITVAGTGDLQIGNACSPTLTSVTINGNVDDSIGGYTLNVINSLVLNGTLELGAADGTTYSTLRLGDGGTNSPVMISGNATIVVGANNGNQIANNTYGGQVTVALGSTVTISGGTVPANATGKLADRFSGDSWLNLGTISCTGSGTGFTVDSANFQNAGKLEASNGAELFLQGTINNSASGQPAGQINVQANSFVNLGGYNSSPAIIGGTITVAGTGDLQIGYECSPTLTSVTINGNVDDTIGAYTLNVINSLALNGTLALGAADGTTYSTLRLGDGGTHSPVTISGNATIVIGANDGNQIANNTYGGLVTLDSTVTVSGGTVPASSGVTGELVDRYSGDSWLNLGTVSCTRSGTGFTVDSANFQNAGTLGASNGGSLILQGTINNGVNGQISVQANSFVNLGGYNSAPSIIGGTITVAGTGDLQIGNACSPTLTGVTINGNVDDTIGGYRLNVINSLVLNGTLALGSTSGSTYSTLQLGDGGTNSPVTISGNATIVIGANVGNQIANNTYGGQVTVALGSTVTISGGTVRASVTGELVDRYSGDSWLNLGTISCTGSGTGFIVDSANFQNAGKLEASNGGELFLQGTINNSASGQPAGQINVQANSFVNLGRYNSSPAIIGGTITVAETGDLQIGYECSPTLTSVTINGNVDDTIGAYTLNVINSLALNGTLALGAADGTTYSTLRLGDGATNSPVTISGNATIVVGANDNNQIENNTYGGLVTLDSTVTVSGGTVPATVTGELADRYSGDSWLNLGTVSCTGSGTEFTVDSANFQNAGTLGASNGGALVLQGTINNSASGQPTGQISVQANSFVNLGGYNSSPSIIGGTMTVAGTGDLQIGNACSPTLTSVTIIGNIDDTIGGYTLNVVNSLILNGTLELGSTSGSTSSILRLGDGATNSPVTISGNATIVVGANNGNQIENNTYGGLVTVTLDSTVTINGGTVPENATGKLVDRFSGDSWLNLGTISCTGSGTGFTVDSANFQNAGTLVASDGGALILQGTINNGVNGQISVQANSFVNLGGYNSAPSIIGGTITVAGTGDLQIGNACSPTLTSVTINGNVDDTIGGYTLNVINSLALNGTLAMGAADGTTYSTLRLGDGGTNSPVTISGNATIASGGNPNDKLVNNVYGGFFTFAPTSNISLTFPGTNNGIIQAVSHDLGPTATGFTNNNDYSNITLSSNAAVNLINALPGGQVGAGYVNSLVVPQGATINLNGLHLYTRVANIQGTIIGGSVQVIPLAVAPSVAITDAGGVYTGNPFPATVTVTGTNNSTVNGSTVVTYYNGNSIGANGTTNAPTTAGTYTAVAAFTSSDPNYHNATSTPVTFTITTATPTVVVIDPSGVYTGSPFSANAAATVNGTQVNGTMVYTYYSGSSVGTNGSATAPSAVGTYTVVAMFTSAQPNNYRNASSTPITFTILPKPTKLVITSTIPSTITAGGSIGPITVQVQDRNGNVVANDTSVLTLNLNGAPFSTIADSTGVVTFSSFQLTKAVKYTISITSSPVLTAAAATINVVAGTPAQLAFLSTQSASVVAGNALAPVRVAVEDSYGNIVTTDTNPVGVSLSALTGGPPAGASILAGTPTVSTTNGVTTFSNLVLDYTGKYSLVVSDTADSGVASLTSPVTTTVTPAPATQMRIIQGLPTSAVTAGVAVSPVQIGLYDQYGNLATNDSSLVTMNLASGQTFSNGQPTLGVHAANGIATFNMAFGTAGSYTLTATDPETSLTNGSLSLGTVQVISAVASKLVITSTIPSTIAAGGSIAPITVQVQDRNGNIVANDTSVLTLNLNGIPVSTIADSTGVVTFASQLLTKAAQDTISITSSPVLTAAATTINVVAGTPAQLAFLSTQSASVVAGNALAPVRVAVEDSYGNIVTTDTNPVGVSLSALTGGPPAGASILAGTPTASTTNGVTTFSNLILDYTGKYSLVVSDTADSGVASLTSPITTTVTPAPATQMRIIQGLPTSAVTAGVAVSPVQIGLYDQYGNLATNDSSLVTMNLASGQTFSNGQPTLGVHAANGIATFNMAFGTAGSYTLTATDPETSLTNGSLSLGTVQVISAVASKLVITSTIPSTIAAGGSIGPITVQVQDRNGNIVANDTSVLTLNLNGVPVSTIADSTGVVTFASQLLTKAAQDTISITSSPVLTAAATTINVVAGTPAQLAFLSTQSASVVAGNALAPVRVAVEDSYGNIVTTDTNPVGVSLSALTGGPPAGASILAGPPTISTTNGVTTFSNLILDYTGKYSLVVSDTADSGVASLTSPVTTTVTPAPATQMRIIQGLPTSAVTAGVAVSPVQIGLYDQYGNLATNDSSLVTMNLASGQTFSNGQPTLGVHAANGIATFNMAFGTAGSYTLTATDPETSLTNGSLSLGTVQVISAVASKLVITSTIPSTIAAGGLTGPITVQVEDRFGNIVANDTSVLTLNLNGVPFFTIADSTGVVTFRSLQLTKAAQDTFSVTSSPILANATELVTVTPGAPRQIVMIAPPADTLATDSASNAIVPTISAAVEDAYGNIIPSAAVNIQFTVIDSSGNSQTAGPTISYVNGVAYFSNFVLTSQSSLYIDVYYWTFSDPHDGIISTYPVGRYLTFVVNTNLEGPIRGGGG